VLVVLALLAGLGGNQRGRDHVAAVAPLSHRTVDTVAGCARLVAGAQLALGGHPPAGSTATVIDSLCTSRPRYIMEDMGWSPRKGDSTSVAGGSGNSDSSREELTHAKVGGQPSHIF